MPVRTSSGTSPMALWTNVINVPPSAGVSRYCRFDTAANDMKMRARDLEQHRPLDRLNVVPEMPVVLSDVTEPTTAWPCLQLHRERTVVGDLMAGSELLGSRRRRCLRAMPGHGSPG